MVEYVHSFLIILLEIACYYLFQDIFIKEDFKRKHIRVSVWIFVMSLLSFIGSYLFVDYFVIKEAYMIILSFLGLQILKPESIRKNLLISVLFIFLLALADFITITIHTQILSTDNGSKEMVDALVVLMSKSVLLLLIMILKRLAGEKWGYATDYVEELWYIIFPIISICIIAAIMSTGYSINSTNEVYFIWGIIFCLIAMNLLLLFYIKNNSEKNYLLQEKRMFEMDAKGQQVLYRSLEEKIELQRSISHDYKNHLSYINGLLQSKEYDKISDYIEKINGTVEHNLDMIDTNNPIINTVVNTKYFEAKNTGAVVVCKINDLSCINIEETDIIVLLSNLFNNAIEAVNKCEKEKNIKFKIVHEYSELIISFQNTYDGVLKRNGDLFQTTKEDEKDFHGIGIKNIIKIVQKYNGEYQFDISDDIFGITIIIPLKKSSC